MWLGASERVKQMRGASERAKGLRGMSKRVTQQEDSWSFQCRPFIGVRPEQPRDYSDPSAVRCPRIRLASEDVPLTLARVLLRRNTQTRCHGTTLNKRREERVREVLWTAMHLLREKNKRNTAGR